MSPETVEGDEDNGYGQGEIYSAIYLFVLMALSTH